MTLDKSFEIGKIYTAKIPIYCYPADRPPSPGFATHIEPDQPFMVLSQKITYYHDEADSIHRNTVTFLLGKHIYQASLFANLDYDFKQII